MNYVVEYWCPAWRAWRDATDVAGQELVFATLPEAIAAARLVGRGGAVRVVDLTGHVLWRSP